MCTLYQHFSYYLLKFMMMYTENFIDGESLFELSEEEICEMLPPIGLTKIMYLIQSVSVYNPMKSSCKFT